MATKKSTKKGTASAVSTTRVNFEAQLFRKKDLPAKLKTEKGRAAEGLWGLQELHLDGEDFAVVFGRTWEGSPDALASRIAKPAAKKKVAATKRAAVKKSPK
ncbi:MAG: hypothetical protein ACOY82_15095 [Pseudomonadota bacterium]